MKNFMSLTLDGACEKQCTSQRGQNLLKIPWTSHYYYMFMLPTITDFIDAGISSLAGMSRTALSADIFQAD